MSNPARCWVVTMYVGSCWVGVLGVGLKFVSSASRVKFVCGSRRSAGRLSFLKPRILGKAIAEAKRSIEAESSHSSEIFLLLITLVLFTLLLYRLDKGPKSTDRAPEDHRGGTVWLLPHKGKQGIDDCTMAF